MIAIYYDDMGYSDMGAYDTSQPTLTPNLDALASGGMIFTAGHSSSAVCTPSRYSYLTGRYSWRTARKSGVTGSYSAPLIEDDRFTFAKMFQSLGYETAMVGKWHIGMRYYDSNGEETSSTNDVDFSKTLSGTPYHVGFDYYFGTSASLDMPPYAWIENDTVLFKGAIVNGGNVDFSQARVATNSDFLNGNPVGANTRNGHYDPNFDIRDYMQVQAAKVVEIIKARSEDGKPFFIYIPMPSPHTPWAVQDAFIDSAGYTYGDYLYQTDHYTGVILDALADPNGDGNTDDSVVDDTVVFISSDNGPEKVAQTQSLNNGRDSNGPFRGVKRDNWEGGTRVPFVVRWPGVVAPDSTTDHACWQGDFFATMAAYLGYDFAENEAPDVESFLPVLRGQSMQAERREGFIQHSVSGQMAIVDKTGVWKLLDGTGGDGYDDTYDEHDNLVTGVKGTRYGTPRQLFNLASDSGESNNLLLSPTAEHLAIESALYTLLNEIRGNTTTGTDGSSSVPLPDNDQDGMPNAYENRFLELDRDDPSDASKDLEPDGLTNLEESQQNTSPVLTDTDDDSLSDLDELTLYNSQPTDADSDSDTLSDGDEVLVWKTSPVLADTDGDGMNDDEELSYFSNPRDADMVPASGPPTEIILNPSLIQLAGFNGTVDDPAVEGGVSSGWSQAGDLFVRSRLSGNEHLKTQLFMRFDLSSIRGRFLAARLRVHQNHKLNASYSTDLELGRVTEDWTNSVGSLPVYDETGVADSMVFGNNGDFGSASSSAGFFSGTAGVAGSDEGFDVSALVEAWLNGTHENYGVRIAISDLSFTGAAFSQFDDPATLDVNEQLQLIVTAEEFVSFDSDGDQLNDAYEMSYFGSLDVDGSVDLDGDGLDVFSEQALGGNPNIPGSLEPIQIDVSMPAVGSITYNRYTKAGLGYELLLSEDLVNWSPHTEFYEYASASPSATLGEDYEQVILAPHSELPAHLFYKLAIRSIQVQ